MMPAKLQGRDEIIIDARVERLWTLISDSKEMENWGPPVRGVTLLDCQRGQEKIGSCRRVGYDLGGKRKGYYSERRTEQVPGKRIAFEIYEDSGPILKFLSRPGAALDIESAGPGKTRVIFSFYHDPRGLGRLLNRLVILPDMRKNRLAALQSLKRYAESGRT